LANGNAVPCERPARSQQGHQYGTKYERTAKIDRRIHMGMDLAHRPMPGERRAPKSQDKSNRPFKFEQAAQENVGALPNGILMFRQQPNRNVGN
jgi:hypothetical protein